MNHLLQENGDELLLESGGSLLLETGPGERQLAADRTVVAAISTPELHRLDLDPEAAAADQLAVDQAAVADVLTPGVFHLVT